MLRADLSDKARVLDILTAAFDTNKSVNYLVKQDKKRVQRIRGLMSYSFEMCQQFGDVFLSDDKSACALMLYPEKKKINLRTIFEDLRLLLTVTGLTGARKALTREGAIKKLQPKTRSYYIWFIGVDPISQNKGTGSELLREILEKASRDKRIVYLETSGEKNIPWYIDIGFQVYNTLNFGYTLYLLQYDGPDEIVS